MVPWCLRTYEDMSRYLDARISIDWPKSHAMNFAQVSTAQRSSAGLAERESPTFLRYMALKITFSRYPSE